MDEKLSSANILDIAPTVSQSGPVYKAIAEAFSDKSVSLELEVDCDNTRHWGTENNCPTAAFHRSTRDDWAMI